MSLENQGVFQLLKEVDFEEFWHFGVHENTVILRNLSETKCVLVGMIGLQYNTD
jgi:hypothetical protein